MLFILYLLLGIVDGHFLSKSGNEASKTDSNKYCICLPRMQVIYENYIATHTHFSDRCIRHSNSRMQSFLPISMHNLCIVFFHFRLIVVSIAYAYNYMRWVCMLGMEVYFDINFIIHASYLSTWLQCANKIQCKTRTTLGYYVDFVIRFGKRILCDNGIGRRSLQRD